MAVLTFRGGVHPARNKKLTASKPAKDYYPKGDLSFPLYLHHGLHAKPVVKGGEWVSAGTLIAEAEGYVSANVHSSVAGIVKYVDFDTIVIENIGENHEEPRAINKPYEKLSKKEIINIIRDAGIVGMGGEEGYPTHIKLSPEDPDKIRYVIVNGCECEPYLTSDYRRLIENNEEFIAGLKIMLLLFPNARGIVAIEDNKPEAIKVLRELCLDEPKIEVKVLKTKYPQGSERQLIYAATGRAINSSMLPADAGCVVDNTDTIFAIYHAVAMGLPLTERIVTVTGDAIRFPQNYKVKCGTIYNSLIELAGGFKDGYPEKIVAGGPMMGMALFDTEVPVTKASSALLCMKKDEVKACKPTNCINCGMCVQACPSRLIPSRLADFAENDDKEQYEHYNGMECVECGSCSYVCPAKRHLAQSIRTMRKQILADRRKK